MFTQSQTGAVTATGTIWMNTGNWTGVSFSFSTSYKEMTSLGTNFTLMSNAPYFAMTTDGRLKYTGNNVITVSANASFTTASSTSKQIGVYKNGSLITGAESSGSGPTCYITNVLTSMSKNDYLSLFAKFAGNTTTAITQVTLSVESLQ